MHPAALEAKVVTIVESVLKGGRAEDDLVELKSTWPDPRTWARQLAGLANRAAGPEIVIIVGVKEDTHELVAPEDIDLEEWWPTLRARFDEDTAPELARHLSVQLPSGEVVYALAFETDRAPYVIKSQDGKAPHLEVPMRSGTTTRWAKRSELLRLLAPHINTPTAVELRAQLSFDPSDDSYEEDGTRTCEMRGFVRFFLEHSGPGFVMFPAYAMTAEVDLSGETLQPRVEMPRLTGFNRTEDPLPRPHGVDLRRDGILAAGPGLCTLTMRTRLSAAQIDAFANSSQLNIRVKLPISGSSNSVELAYQLSRRDTDGDPTIYFSFVGPGPH